MCAIPSGIWWLLCNSDVSRVGSCSCNFILRLRGGWVMGGYIRLPRNVGFASNPRMVTFFFSTSLKIDMF